MTEADDEGWRAPKRVTLEDVARHAEVSRALVSIVMREAPGASSATRERILAAAKELGYRPDVRARALAGQKSRLIGVMFGVEVGIFQFDLLEGLYAAAEQRGLGLIVAPLTKGRGERQAAESLHDFRFDALIMLGPPTARPLLAGRVPLVVVGWHVDDPTVDVVRTSDEHGMARAVDHLVALGHSRIAHIDGGENMIGISRRNGYQHAMRERGLAAYIQVVPGGQTQLDGQRACASAAGGGRPADRSDHVQRRHRSRSDRAAGRSTTSTCPASSRSSAGTTPQVAALSPVGLTTVVQQPAEMARLAVERIVARIEGRRIEGHEIVLEPDLQLRSQHGHR